MTFFASMAMAGLLAQAAPTAAAPAPTTFPLRVSIVAGADGAPVAGREWLEAQIGAAQELFVPFGVGFARTDGPALDAGAAHVETRADRDALAARAAPHVIDVFVVASLRDVDVPDQMRRGVHWHAPSGTHYLILVAGAPPSVLAHELGHYFGNAHSAVADNVMSYERTGAPVFFDAAQGKRIASRARAYVRSGELSPVAR
jgi:hypothetical protein